MLEAAKIPLILWWYLPNKRNIKKIIEGELVIRNVSTTLHHKLFIFMLSFKVVFKSMTGPDDTHQLDLQELMG